MWFRKNKWKITAAVMIIAALAAAFFFGGSAPQAVPATSDVIEAAPNPVDGQTEPLSEEETPEPAETEAPQSEMTETPEAPAAHSPAPTPAAEPEKTALSCTISISCETVLDNMEKCDSAKAELIPANGWILGPLTASFADGESVFDVLKRVCRENGVHLEFSETPAYGSVYIEGIYNLYEFDVGELSGWMYSVNGWFPNYSSSLYKLADGDTISWVYSCNQGADVGSAA